MPSRPPPARMKWVASRWPRPREPKCTPDPDAVGLVREQVDVVVAGADGAKLGARHVAVLRGLGKVPAGVIVEQLVLHRLAVLAADAEREGAPQVVHDRADVAAQLPGIGVQQHRLVAAGHVEADSGWADVVGIGDHAAHGDRVAEVVIGHEGGVVGALPAALHLLHGAGVGDAPHRQRVDHLVRGAGRLGHVRTSCRTGTRPP